MSSTKRGMSMEISAWKIIKTSLKFTNFILCIVGISILMFSLWMIVVILHKYTKYFFASWFLWTTIAFGITFCFSSGIGYIAAVARSKTFLSIYIISISMLLLMESLVLADLSLNDKWKKDFPKDPTKRFEDFAKYVEDHSSTFKLITSLTLLLQMSGVGLALALRVMIKERWYLDNDGNQVSAGLPFMAHQVVPASPYVLGHPFHPAHHGNVKEVDNFVSSGEKDAWLMSTHGCPPPYCA